MVTSTPIASRVLPARSRVIFTTAIVVGVAAVAGILTGVGDHHLPRSINAVANSSAPWAMVTFASVYLAQATCRFAAILGALSFLVMDLAFYGAFDLLGGYYPHHYLTFWMVVAIAIGPVVGICASWLRSPRELRREIAVAAPSSILVGEGVFILARLPGVSTPYALACVLAGGILFAVLAAPRLRRVSRIAISFSICVVAASAFYAIYGLLPLVLDKTVP